MDFLPIHLPLLARFIRVLSLPAERGRAAEGGAAGVAAGQAIARQGQAVGTAQRRFDGERELLPDTTPRLVLWVEWDLSAKVATKDCRANSMRPSTRPSRPHAGDDDLGLADAIDGALPLADKAPRLLPKLVPNASIRAKVARTNSLQQQFSPKSNVTIRLH